MIGVVVPAHDEEACIDACLVSIRQAAGCHGLAGETVEIIVVLDRCSDGTAPIVARHGVVGLALDAGNVGAARAAGTALAIAGGARWVACTDADTQVPQDWLSAQLACGGDAFCGVVTVHDWQDYGLAVREAFLAGESRCDGHPHVHGANLGFSAEAYLRCGGFPPMPAHEDVALVAALASSGARIARRAAPVVVTSARRNARAGGGFSGHLLALEARLVNAARTPSIPAPAGLPVRLRGDGHVA